MGVHEEEGEGMFFIYNNVGMRLNEIVPGAISMFSFRKYVFFFGCWSNVDTNSNRE
jgi:hypothetical protein